jgi:hypothetical protein
MGELPKYMNMRQMADALGTTSYLFRRLFDKHQLPYIQQGRDNLVEVKPALKILAKVQGIEALLSYKGLELLRKSGG